MASAFKGMGLALALALAALPAAAQESARPAEPASETPAATEGPAQALAPEAAALRDILAAFPEGATDEDKSEVAAVRAFYEARAFAPLWVAGEALSPKAVQLLDEVDRADDWGLSRRDFPTPAVAALKAGKLSPQSQAAAEGEITFTALKYGRFARGGRIINPAEQLSSYLDRRPQLLKPALILDGLATAEDTAVYLRGLHPQHPQFEKLRQKYLAARGHKPGSSHDLEARKILANMEQWRWMPADMGAVYIWNNLPEFMQRVVVDGQVVRTERIVAGETGK